MATGLVFLTGVYRLASKWIDRRSIHPGAPDPIVERLDEIQADIEHLKNEQVLQLDEMNERIDFAEGKLANPAQRAADTEV